jgi:hypothetical protein
LYLKIVWEILEKKFQEKALSLEHKGGWGWAVAILFGDG